MWGWEQGEVRLSRILARNSVSGSQIQTLSSLLFKVPGGNRKSSYPVLSMSDPGDQISRTHSCQKTTQNAFLCSPRSHFRCSEEDMLQSAVILFHRVQPKSIGFYSQNILAQRHSIVFDTASET